MPKRARFIVFLGLALIVVFATGISAGAAPKNNVQVKQNEISSAQARLAEIQKESSASYESYNNALYQLNELDKDMSKTSNKLAYTKKQLSASQQELQTRATQVYKSGNVAFLDVLVGVDDFSEFASRLDVWMKILGQERAEFESVLKAKNQLEAEQAKLQDQRNQRAAALQDASKQKEQSENAEAEAKAYLGSLNSDLQTAIQAQQAQQTAKAQAAAKAAAAKAAAATAPVETAPAAATSKPPIVQPKVVQVAQQVDTSASSQKDLQAKRKAADKQAAERVDQAAAAEAAAQKAQHEAELAQKQAMAQKKADQRAAAQQAAAERKAAAEKAQKRAEQAAIEKAAAERAAQQAAQEQAAQKAAAAQQAADKQAARQAAQDQAAAARQAARQAARDQAAKQTTTDTTQPTEDTTTQPATDSGGTSQQGDGSTPSSSGGSGGSSSSSGSAVVAEAETWLGVPYVYGGASRSGVDCSGLTMMVYSKFGISLPHSAAGQYGYGSTGSGSAGDLVFWDDGGGISHVGIATGSGTVIHAPYPGTVVREEGIWSNGYVGAKTLL